LVDLHNILSNVNWFCAIKGITIFCKVAVRGRAVKSVSKELGLQAVVVTGFVQQSYIFQFKDLRIIGILSIDNFPSLWIILLF
jgi:hypothetical protein